MGQTNFKLLGYLQGKINTIVIFSSKFIIFVRWAYCGSSRRAPNNLATPLIIYITTLILVCDKFIGCYLKATSLPPSLYLLTYKHFVHDLQMYSVSVFHSKYELFSLSTSRRYIREAGVQLHAFLTSALDGGQWRYALAALTPGR